MRSTPRRLQAIGLAVALGIASFGAVGAPTPPADAPAGTTALCNDGSYSSSADRRGACRGHRGIQLWYAREAGAASSASTEAHPSEPRGDKVWVNGNTKVYHCPDSDYFGKTTNGFYMTEADAKAKGYHPNQNQNCF